MYNYHRNIKGIKKEIKVETLEKNIFLYLNHMLYHLTQIFKDDKDSKESDCEFSKFANLNFLQDFNFEEDVKSKIDCLIKNKTKTESGASYVNTHDSVNKLMSQSVQSMMSKAKNFSLIILSI
jgi:hypothetical protein